AAAINNETVTVANVSNNVWDGGACTNCAALNFPTTNPANITGFDIIGNTFKNWPAPASTGNIANYQGSFGSISLTNGSIVRTDFPILTNAAQTLYSSLWGNDANATENNVRSAIVGSGTVWKMTCTISDTPGGTSTRKFTVRKGTGASANASAAT